MKKYRRYPSQSLRHRTKGVVLIVALFVLVAITLLSVASMESLGLGERMAGNFKDRQLAFQIAEATLRDAESAIRDNTVGPFSPFHEVNFTEACNNKLCKSKLDSTSIASTFTAAQWSESGTKTWAFGSQTGADSITTVSGTPTYVVEFLTTAQPIVDSGQPCVAIFRVTTRATGANPSTSVILESLFRFRAGECYAVV
jgi:type IV pilus assembly protein PilX